MHATARSVTDVRRWAVIGDEVGRPSARMEWLLRRVVSPLVAIAYRPSLTGTEHLPRERPFLLVANHSAGVGLAEILGFACLYLKQVGVTRPIAGFAHPIGFRVWPISAVVRGLGAIPSTYEAAERTLERGIPLLVFPGGDHETLRPVWQGKRVDFGGRKGFLRVALRAGVPIVPMGISGSHYTAPVLVRSKLLARVLVLPRALGLKRWGLTVLGLAVAGFLVALPVALWIRVALLWVWLTSPLVFVPFVPWTIRFRIGAPLEPDALFGAGPAEEVDLDAALASVVSAVQALVT